MTDQSDLPPLTELPPGTAELNGWLQVATSDLCDEARMRVRDEVQTHFLAMYEQLLATTSHSEAVDMALSNLGHPKRANRNYKRIHLTAAEERDLAKMGETSRAALIGIWTLGLFMFVLSVLQTLDTGRFHLFPIILLPAIICLFTIQYFATSKSALAKARLYYVIYLEAALAVYVGYGAFRWWTNSLDGRWGYALLMTPVLIAFGIQIRSDARLVRKLKKFERRYIS